MMLTIRLLVLVCVCFLSFHANAQTALISTCSAEISKIKAIDNHAHPLRYVAGAKSRMMNSTRCCGPIVPFPLPVRLSPSNAEFIRACIPIRL